MSVYKATVEGRQATVADMPGGYTKILFADGEMVILGPVPEAAMDHTQFEDLRKDAASDEARDERGRWTAAALAKLPPLPGTAPLKDGNVRLYHQTGAENIESIKQQGLTIEHAKGYEGPRAIYASDTPFYGSITTRPTVEFQVPKGDFYGTQVNRDVTPADFIGVHEPWHTQARYLLDNPKAMDNLLSGKYDDLEGPYKTAVDWLKTQVPKAKSE